MKYPLWNINQHIAKLCLSKIQVHKLYGSAAIKIISTIGGFFRFSHDKMNPNRLQIVPKLTPIKVYI